MLLMTIMARTPVKGRKRRGIRGRSDQGHDRQEQADRQAAQHHVHRRQRPGHNEHGWLGFGHDAPHYEGAGLAPLAWKAVQRPCQTDSQATFSVPADTITRFSAANPRFTLGHKLLSRFPVARFAPTSETAAGANRTSGPSGRGANRTTPPGPPRARTTAPRAAFARDPGGVGGPVRVLPFSRWRRWRSRRGGGGSCSGRTSWPG